MGFRPIGHPTQLAWSTAITSIFVGVYDGGNHTISNLFIGARQTNIHYSCQRGLFSNTIDSTLKNIHLQNVVMNPTGMINRNVGAIIGYSSNSILKNSSASGSVITNDGATWDSLLAD